jgi:hypothetical protein
MALLTLIRLRQEFYHHGQQHFAYLDFNYNQLEITAFYDRNDNRLIFVKKMSRDEFEIEIDDYFNININLETIVYKQLIAFLELQYQAGNPFIPSEFFKQFDQDFIWREQSTPRERVYLNIRKDLEDPDAIYYQRTIDHRGKNNGHVSNKNREKVRILLPKLYEHIKNYDISIGFSAIKTDTANDTQSEIIQQLEE